MKRTFSLNMTLSQAIKLLGYTAIYSVVKEMIQLRRTRWCKSKRSYSRTDQ